MIRVHVAGDTPGIREMMQLGHNVQSRFKFVDNGRGGPIRLAFADAAQGGLTSVDRERGVRVSTWHSEEICAFAELRQEDYLLVCSVMGLTKLRTLMLNPDLIEEDFIHRNQPSCLYASKKHAQDYALALEQRHVCGGCLEFFRCLGAEPEVEALQSVLHYLAPVTHRNN